MQESELLRRCGGIKVTKTTVPRNNGTSWIRTQYFLDGDFVVPDDVFIKIDGTACKGTIGRLVDIDFSSHRSNNEVTAYDITFIIQVDGRAKTNRITHWHAVILEDHDGSTKYVRNIKKKEEQPVIPPHVNKYNQPILKGDWVVGLGTAKTIYFGEVTRWTKSSVFVNPTLEVKGSKDKCITVPHESLVLPAGVDYEQMVLMMALGGWTK